MSATISKDNTRIIVVVPKTLKEQVEELAKSENRSMSNYVRYLLKKEVAKQNKKKAHK